jgi:hypothetical protein
MNETIHGIQAGGISGALGVINLAQMLRKYWVLHKYPKPRKFLEHRPSQMTENS